MPILSLEDWGEPPMPPHILESFARQNSPFASKFIPTPPKLADPQNTTVEQQESKP